MARATVPSVEPGVLSLFRGFCLLAFGLVSFSFCSVSALPDYFARLLWVTSGLMVVYLSWNGLAARLGRWHLPLGLVVYTLVITLGDSGLNVLYQMHGYAQHESMGDGLRLYFWLVLPLVVISAQYRLRVLLLFTVSTSVLPLLVTLVVDPALLNAQLTHAGVRLTLYSFVGYLIVIVTNAQKRQRAELAAKNAQLTHYAATLEQLTVARERNRLSRELHDTLAHTLSAVNVQLKALEVLWEQNPAQARAALHATQALTRSGLQESRRALAALRASPIEELGLRLALAQLVRQAAERAGTALALHLPAQLPMLAPDVEQHLYRLTEEAMSNIVQHAHARTITVRLEVDEHALTLLIADDGVGFDVSAAHDGHYGLHGMRERAALLNGDLAITSTPGGGTTLRLRRSLEGT